MRVKDLVGLGFALVAAIGVAYVTRLILTKNKTEHPQNQAQEDQLKGTSVMVAAVPLNVGDLVDANSLKWMEWPKNMQGTHHYLTKANSKIEDFVGAVVRQSVHLGEPLTSGDLIKPGERSFLAAILKPGMRAISINVNEASASSGLLAPGDMVDVIVSKNVQSGSGDQGGQQLTESQTIVQNVRLMAMGKKLKADTSNGSTPAAASETPKTATLEVTKSQAEAIARAQKEGEILLSVHSLANDPNPCQGKDCPDDLTSGTGNVKIMRGEKSSNVLVNER